MSFIASENRQTSTLKHASIIAIPSEVGGAKAPPVTLLRDASEGNATLGTSSGLHLGPRGALSDDDRLPPRRDRSSSRSLVSPGHNVDLGRYKFFHNSLLVLRQRRSAADRGAKLRNHENSLCPFRTIDSYGITIGTYRWGRTTILSPMNDDNIVDVQIFHFSLLVAAAVATVAIRLSSQMMTETFLRLSY